MGSFKAYTTDTSPFKELNTMAQVIIPPTPNLHGQHSHTLWEFMLSQFAIRSKHEEHLENPYVWMTNLGNTFEQNMIDENRSSVHSWIYNDDHISQAFSHMWNETVDFCDRTTFETTHEFQVLTISEVASIASHARGEAMFNMWTQHEEARLAAEEARLAAEEARIAAEEAQSLLHPAVNTWTHTDLEDNVHVDCGICLGTVEKQQTTRTTCGHVFCNVCLQEWISRSRTCPMCRQNV